MQSGDLFSEILERGEATIAYHFELENRDEHLDFHGHNRGVVGKEAGMGFELQLGFFVSERAIRWNSRLDRIVQRRRDLHDFADRGSARSTRTDHYHPSLDLSVGLLRVPSSPQGFLW
ncbi:MAG: hypothetical protein HKL81_00580 [Acidimicrobiaceae bacterium]|nr:hypothetical protein [Acidimicrobiaceae bacterium]